MFLAALSIAASACIVVSDIDPLALATKTIAVMAWSGLFKSFLMSAPSVFIESRRLWIGPLTRLIAHCSGFSFWVGSLRIYCFGEESL